jgi:hypothetical protein
LHFERILLITSREETGTARIKPPPPEIDDEVKVCSLEAGDSSENRKSDVAVTTVTL